jgi:hypothetical protein
VKRASGPDFSILSFRVLEGIEHGFFDPYLFQMRSREATPQNMVNHDT